MLGLPLFFALMKQGRLKKKKKSKIEQNHKKPLEEVLAIQGKILFLKSKTHMLIFNVKPWIKNSFKNITVWNTYKSIALLKAQISATLRKEVSPNSFLSLEAKSRYSLLSPFILSAQRKLCCGSQELGKAHTRDLQVLFQRTATHPVALGSKHRAGGNKRDASKQHSPV